MQKLLLLPLASLLLLAFSLTDVQAQETEPDPYEEYSYLWADPPKKKKRKKERRKKNKTQESIPADSVNSSPSYEVTTEYPSTDTTKQKLTTEKPEETEAPDPEEDTSNDPPVQDFRAPLSSAVPGGSFTGGFTFTRIGNESFVGLVLSPEFAIGKVGVGLNVPILYGLDSKKVRTEIFKNGAGPLRLIRYVRYGNQKQDPVYVKVGELQNTMIGFGGLVNNYTNSASYEKRKVGLHYDINYRGIAGIEGLYSDFDPSSFNLFVIRPYVRPLAQSSIPIIRTLEVGTTFVTDKDQTSNGGRGKYALTKDGVNAFGIDMGLTLLRVPFIQIDLFANYSSLNIKSDSLNRLSNVLKGDPNFTSGSGFSVGVNFRMHVIANIMSTDIRIERLSYKDHYLPQFFDGVYELNKDVRISSLVGAEKKSGIYGSLTGHILQKVELGGSLLIPDNISAAAPAVVQVRATAERVADKFSLYGSYIKGNLTDLGDAFTFDENSLAKIRFIYHLNKFLATGVDYYWTFNRVSDGTYKASKYVMPYFGVNIKF